MISTGKEGTIYVLNWHSVGHFPGDQVVQELVHALPAYTADTGNYRPPSYWNGNVYFCAVAHAVRQFSLSKRPTVG